MVHFSLFTVEIFHHHHRVVSHFAIQETDLSLVTAHHE